MIADGASYSCQQKSLLAGQEAGELNFAPLIFQLPAAGVSTFPTGGGLLQLQRAVPSAALDKGNLIVNRPPV